jgi:uncharacterized protein (TIGR03435 family)
MVGKRMRDRFGVVMLGLLLAAGAAHGQAAPAVSGDGSARAAAGKLTFDVASVRPSPPLDMAKLQADMQAGKMPNFGVHINGLRAEYNYQTLKDLIVNAYKVKPLQVTGPSWLGSEHYDIVAKMPDGATRDDAPKMLRALLEERFKLVVHRETQEHSVLALVVGKGGPKMKGSPGDAPPLDEDEALKPGEMKIDTPDGPARMTVNKDGSGATMNMGAKGIITYKMDPQTQILHMDSTKTTMAALADMLTQVMQMGGGGGRQVLDMTDLKGNYEVSLEFSLADVMAATRAQGNMPGGGGGAGAAAAAVASDPGGGGSTVYASVEKLGLKLEQRKAPVEQIVVDSADKTPTEN